MLPPLAAALAWAPLLPDDPDVADPPLVLVPPVDPLPLVPLPLLDAVVPLVPVLDDALLEPVDVPVSVAWHWPPSQVPPTHAVPSGSTGNAHVPASTSQVPAPWHPSGGVQSASLAQRQPEESPTHNPL